MYLFGQAAAAGGGGAGQAPGSPFGMFIPFILIFVVFYFLIIMPARKKQKQHQSLISSLKVGERVVTTGGIYGTVTRVLEDRFEIEVDKGTRLQIAKGSVSSVIPPDAGQHK